MSRFFLVFGIVLVLTASSASDAAAQRKGFIIGFGVGPGYTTGDVRSKLGLASDFKIGAMVGESVQVYYTSKSNLLLYDSDPEASGVSGLGATFEMASGFNVNGTIGLSTWTDFDSGTDAGFGLGAGFGYEFADLWVLNLGGTWGVFEGAHVINIAATISILSH